MSKNGVEIDWKIPRLVGPSIDLASHSCEHNYSVEILSIDPLVIYLNSFVSDEEIQYLLDLRYVGSQMSALWNLSDQLMPLF